MTLLKRDFKKKMDEEAHTSTFKKGTGQASDFKERSPPEKKREKEVTLSTWGSGVNFWAILAPGKFSP